LIELGSRDLTLDDVWDVAMGATDVRLSDDVREKVAASRAVVEELVASDQVVYGVTTGFGDLASKRIAHSDVETLQHNLLVSHSVGVGEPHSTEVVRAMLLLRANALAQGYSGCRPVVIERLLEFVRTVHSSRGAITRLRGRVRRPRATGAPGTAADRPRPG